MQRCNSQRSIYHYPDRYIRNVPFSEESFKSDFPYENKNAKYDVSVVFTLPDVNFNARIKAIF